MIALVFAHKIIEDHLALERRIKAALPAQRLPQANASSIHSEDARLSPTRIRSGGLDAAAARITRRAAPRAP